MESRVRGETSGDKVQQRREVDEERERENRRDGMEVNSKRQSG